MRLKSLYIQGFKSFANKTKIEFNDEITCIVGPNGSGKSNIADAITWVLGESSAKNLRGDKMEDVIFSGSANKKSLSLAEVTILFDNSDRTLNLDYDEVSVTRRMYRSSETEFLINNTKCRLKDIKELFMDTGIGKDGYSLIGQGKIGSILNTKAEQRRSVFDEAAGISKYKMKKQQSENKLKNTEDNIIRLNDIISQMKDREEILRVEAEKAKEFKTLSQELKLYELADSKKKVLANRQKLKGLEEESSNIEEEIKKIDESLKVLRENKISLESQEEKIESFIDEKQNIYYRLDNKIEKNKNQLDFISNRSKDIEEINRSSNLSVEKLANSNQILEKEIEELKLSVAEKNQRKNDLLKEVEEVKDLLNAKLEEEKIQEELRQKESEKRLENHRKKSFFESRLSLSESLIQDRKARLETIDKNLNILLKNNDEILESKDNQARKIEDLNKEKISIEENIKIINKSLEENKSSLSQEVNKYESIRNEISNKAARLNALKNISENYEGYSKSVKLFMNATKNEGLFKASLLGPVADNIKLEKKYEKAISIALGYAQQNIIIKNENDAAQMVNYLNKKRFGRVTFLPIDSLRFRKANIDLSTYNIKGLLGFANQFVKYDKEIERVIDFLLARIIICQDFNSAKAISSALNKSYRVVSLDGDSFNIGGSITAGETSRNSNNLLSRKVEIDQLKLDIKNLDLNQGEIKNNINLLESESEKLKTSLDSEYESQKDILSRIQKAESILINLKDTKISNDKYIEDYQDQKERLVFEIENNKKENEDYKFKLEEIDKLMSADQSQTNQDMMAELKKDIEAKKDKKVSLDIKLVEISSEVKSLEREISNKEDLIKNNKSDILAQDEKIKTNEIAITENQAKLENIKESIFKLESDMKLSDKELKESKTQLSEIKDKLTKVSQEIEDKRDILIKSEKDLIKIQAKFDKFKENINLNLEFIKNKYEINLDENDVDIESLKNIRENINSLNEKIKELGQVNILAIDEYRELKEEYDFNLKQKDDLLLSRKEIINVILELEDEMQKSFKDTFNKVAKYFNEIFVELFNGGQAKLSIVGDDLLESGIEINVQPPGKKLQSLSLLSGGERSLTAVALLFAFLKVRPAPFCILDEIDAALDDSNILRYADYIKSIEDIQFIIITHRKLSMEIANALYGVTMEEKGVSKLISVKLKK